MKYLICYNSKRPYINFVIICIWTIYLWSHIKKWSNISITKWWNFSYIPKVNNLYQLCWFIDEYILRFNISMHKSFIMNIIQSYKYLLDNIPCFLLIYPSLNMIFQSSSTPFKNHHNFILSLLMIKQFNHIRMLQLIQCSYLILNSRILLFISLFRNHLFMNCFKSITFLFIPKELNSAETFILCHLLYVLHFLEIKLSPFRYSDWTYWTYFHLIITPPDYT